MEGDLPSIAERAAGIIGRTTGAGGCQSGLKIVLILSSFFSGS